MIKTVLLAVLLAAPHTFAAGPYPKIPDASLTPGSICQDAVSYRYAERIPYCDREVDPKQKILIINNYDSVLHYRIKTMPRKSFKIDHFIPLCMGGSNENKNLWPQHESVYKVTDPLEQKLCEKMAEGKMLQAEAIDLIKRAKTNLPEAQQIFDRINSL